MEQNMPWKVIYDGKEERFVSFIHAARLLNVLSQNNQDFKLFFREKDVTKRWWM